MKSSSPVPFMTLFSLGSIFVIVMFVIRNREYEIGPGMSRFLKDMSRTACQSGPEDPMLDLELTQNERNAVLTQFIRAADAHTRVAYFEWTGGATGGATELFVRFADRSYVVDNDPNHCLAMTDRQLISCVMEQ
eukprot:331314_1